MAQAIEPETVIVYQSESGKEPFTEWLYSLRDQKGRRTILKRIGRLEQGLYGDYKSVGDGVFELRIFFGPGYRVYFGEDDGHIVILLNGGDKDSQDKDIKTAQAYWKDYKDNG